MPITCPHCKIINHQPVLNCCRCHKVLPRGGPAEEMSRREDDTASTITASIVTNSFDTSSSDAGSSFSGGGGNSGGGGASGDW
jgi:uncharacterized membrane protein YgcG